MQPLATRAASPSSPTSPRRQIPGALAAADALPFGPGTSLRTGGAAALLTPLATAGRRPAAGEVAPRSYAKSPSPLHQALLAHDNPGVMVEQQPPPRRLPPYGGTAPADLGRPTGHASSAAPALPHMQPPAGPSAIQAAPAGAQAAVWPSSDLASRASAGGMGGGQPAGPTQRFLALGSSPSADVSELQGLDEHAGVCATACLQGRGKGSRG